MTTRHFQKPIEVFKKKSYSVYSEILSEGGSAVDAAIASLFCNGLVNGQSMGLGGGFIMTLFIKGKPYSLIARETAPSKAKAGMFVKHQGLSRTGDPLKLHNSSLRATFIIIVTRVEFSTPYIFRNKDISPYEIEDGYLRLMSNETFMSLE